MLREHQFKHQMFTFICREDELFPPNHHQVVLALKASYLVLLTLIH